jgi:hypothetical protein
MTAIEMRYWGAFVPHRLPPSSSLQISCPVSIAAREGEHEGAGQNAFVKGTPSLAMRSTFGGAMAIPPSAPSGFQEKLSARI